MTFRLQMLQCLTLLLYLGTTAMISACSACSRSGVDSRSQQGQASVSDGREWPGLDRGCGKTVARGVWLATDRYKDATLNVWLDQEPAAGHTKSMQLPHS